MSYEGYSQLLCKNGHNWEVDCNDMPQEYEEPRDELCPKCNEPAIWENTVNITNGSFDEDGERIDGFVELEVEGEISGDCSCCGEKHICQRIYKIPKDETVEVEVINSDVKKCKFCGEADAVKSIINPNDFGEFLWDVCEECGNYIKKKTEEHFKEYIKARKEELFNDTKEPSDIVGHGDSLSRSAEDDRLAEMSIKGVFD